MSDKLWNLGTTVAALGGAMVAKKVAEGIWKKSTGSQAPDDPEDPAASWGQAALFAVLSGAVVQLVRMAISRQSTRTYINVTGHRP